jgi:toxin ParE1/3/4
MATNRAEYRLTPKAAEDMEAVWLYSLAQWGAHQTERYIDDLSAAFALLVKNPRAGTGCDHIREGYRKYPVMRHMVYYRLSPYGIEIIRILHERMLAPRHL